MPMSTLAPLSSLLYTPDEAADMLRTKARTLERWRHTGGGPVFLKVGRRVVYRYDDLEQWLTQQRRAHTSTSVPPERSR
jgi:excisionase family DNA binding protein